MSAVLQRMNVDAFLAWSEGQEGRFELDDGVVVAMAPERLLHVEAKGEVFAALRDAIRAAGAPCRVLVEGATVRVDPQNAYVPDALVYCGPPLPGATVECPNPVIVVEILSPSTRARDLGVKQAGYFKLPSLHHYLIVDPERRLVIHHRRGPGGVENTEHRYGTMMLDPPGLTVPVAAMLPAV